MKVFPFFLFIYCQCYSLFRNYNKLLLDNHPNLVNLNHFHGRTEKSLNLINKQNNNIIDSCKLEEMKTEKDFLNNKKLITISPGGYKGFYTHGNCIYIKEHYDLSDYLFSGASAGAWNALFMTCKKNMFLPSKYIVESVTQNTKSIFDLQNQVKENILGRYTTDDFELDKLFIGVTTLHFFKVKTTIYSNFCNLEDAIDCCFASSHIPLITGYFFNKYKNVISFDGGFSKNPYFDSIESNFHISPSLWNENKNELTKPTSIDNITTLFSKDKYDCNQLLIDGYNDAELHKYFLDKIFVRKN